MRKNSSWIIFRIAAFKWLINSLVDIKEGKYVSICYLWQWIINAVMSLLKTKK